MLLEGCALMPVSTRKRVRCHWEPHIYLPMADGKCEFQGAESGYKVECGSPEMQEMYLAPLSDLDAIQDALDECEDLQR